jgi:hypothetical protein
MQPNELSVDAESSATSAEISTDGEMLSGSGLSPNFVSIALPGLHYLQSGGTTRSDASLKHQRESLGRETFSGGILSRVQFRSPAPTK